MVSYGGKQFQDGGRPPFWKSIYRHNLSEKSSDFREILYTAADFELDERHVIKNEKVALDRLRVRQNVFLVSTVFLHNILVEAYGSVVDSRKQCENIRNRFLQGVVMYKGYEKSRLLTYSSLDLANDIKCRLTSYNGRRIGTRMQSVEWCRFRWAWMLPNTDFKGMQLC